MLIRLIKLSFVFLAAAAVFVSCEGRCEQGTPHRQWFVPDGRLKVLSTTAMIHNLVEEIGGDSVDGAVLICGELDPHTYQLVKGDDEKLAFADLIFHNGLGLEHGPSLQYYLVGSNKAVSLGDAVRKAHPDKILYLQNQLDPHIWMDMSLWAQTIDPIVEALGGADPENAERYRERGDALYEEMMALHNRVKEILREIPDSNRFLVTSHDAFNYFAKAYLATDEERAENNWSHRFEAPEGLAPESQISVSDIRKIIEHLEKNRINVLFAESNVSKDSIRKIVSAGNEKGLKLKIAEEPLYGDAMGAKGSGADTYQMMILHNAKTLRRHLK
jgi:manganese/zinc/iron transport system substrate-binding protein